MDKDRRLVYTSMGNHVHPAERSKPKKYKKKNNHNRSNQLIDSAAKVYLKNPKLLPRHEISSLIKSSRHSNDKGSFLLRSNLRHQIELAEELERREVEGSFFRRAKNPDREPNHMAMNEAQSEVALRSEKPRPVTCSRPKKYQQICYEKQIPKQEEGIDSTDLQDQIQERKELIAPRMRESFRDVYSFKRSLPSPSNKDSTKLFRSSRNQIISVSSQSKQISRNNNSKNSNIRRLDSRTSQDSMNSSVSQIKKQAPITARNLKTFVTNEKHQMVSEFLKIQGWKAVGLQSQLFCLKWTYNQSFKDYETVRTRNKTDRTGKAYYNHIKNNKLVKKDEFHKLTRELGNKNIKINGFIPQTFLLAPEKELFVKDYQKRVLMILIRKHHLYFNGDQQDQQKSYSIEDVVNEMVRLGSFSQSSNLLEALVQDSQSTTALQCNKIGQISLMYYLVAMGCSLWICQQVHNCEVYEKIFSSVCEDQKIKAMLIKCSKLQLPFEQQQTANVRSGKEEYISIKNGYIRTTKTFMKPSKWLRKAIGHLHKYLRVKFEDYEVGGSRNLWIAKPCSGSRGCGIQIIDKPERINQFLDGPSSQHRVIQKYIENVWILTPQLASGNEQLLKSNILGKKFDIRQWVLMTHDQAYIFSHFYAKICSKNYDVDAAADHQVHLSNYTLNKQGFSIHGSSSSVCSQEELQKVFEQLSMLQQFEQMKQSMRDSLHVLVQEALKQSESIPGTFELVGFDIVVDSNLRPWVIECNMSPACDTRTPWLGEMKRSMTAGALELILEKEGFQNPCTEGYRWQKLGPSLLSKQGIKESQTAERLQIISSKINKKKSMAKKFRKETLRIKVPLADG